ncbi:hypothetical protein AUC43_13925 [Hymenobacter sedentarius]|uniref:Uncharacterized protein n=1 Tax=Hymenobacter sedentarius TaxID=1411621 RepID=A0A0U4AZC0_9BACT|nr:hypothetical protein [Hymenobacter sedentarius]ALW86093.1 hypothetical protein AUC43_13925 [Hymenobacter sedentarius]
MHSLLPGPKGWKFVEVDYGQAMQHYSGFGKDIFKHLEQHIPGVILAFRFFCSTASQKVDLYAVYEKEDLSFAIQLDPDCEVICFWNLQGLHHEIGTWALEPYAEAIQFIEGLLV